MFHRKLVIWGILSAALVFGCSGEKLHSQPKMNKIEVDGRDADWSDYKTNYYEKENMRIVLGVVNDDSSINILIRFRDFRLARMFERRGVTLWLNSENKKKKTLGIHYINEASKYMAPPAVGGFRERSGEHPPMENMRRFRGTFSFIKEGVYEKIPAGGLDGVAAAADVREGTFCYEYEIPLRANTASSLALTAGPGDAIKLGIEIPPLSEEERQKLKEWMKEKGGGGMRGKIRGGAGGSRRGGRMGGGGMRGVAPGRQMPDIEGKEFWMTVLLSNRAVEKK